MESEAWPAEGYLKEMIAAEKMACPVSSDWCTEMAVGFRSPTISHDEYGFRAGSHLGSLDDTTIERSLDTWEVEHLFFLVGSSSGVGNPIESRRYSPILKLRLDNHLPRGSELSLKGMTFTLDAASERGGGAYYWDAPDSVRAVLGEKMTVSVKFPASGTPATGQPLITGTAQVGQTLTAGTDDIADDDGLEDATFSYQWVRVDDGTNTDITDATTNTYTLTTDDAGKKVRVKVSFTDDEGNAEEATSDAWPSEGSIVAASTEVALSLGASSVTEDAGATSITVAGTLNGATRTTDTTVTVVVGASGDAALEGADYATVSDLTLTIDAGETSGTETFTLTPRDDDVDEGDETLSVTGTTTATDLSVTGTRATIVDDERRVEVSATTLTVPEGGTATYTVALESEPTATVTVTPSVSGDADVTVSPSSLSFSTGDWNTAKTVTVSAAQDADADDDTAAVSHAVSGADYASETASGVSVTVTDDDTETPADPPTVVPGNWPLIPAGLGPGDEFRLLAKTKSPLKPDSTSTDVADYNDYVQEQVRARGHMAVQDYADNFRVLGSTTAVNVRTNTGTTGSGGVPIYWLNGERVADDYGDFYDGTWSNKNNGRGVAGDLITGNSASARQLLCTGTADDGTTTDLPLGGGDPESNGTSECTATSIAITSNTLGGDVLDVSGRARYLALSNVFQVGRAVVPTIEDVSISSNPGSDGEYTTDDEIRIALTFSEAVLVTGNPFLLFRIDALNDEGDLVQRNRRASYDHEASTSTALVFSYTVRSVDFDRDGIWVKADKLRLNGGAVQNAAGDTDADLSYAALAVQSRHKIHVAARATGASVVSTPAVGTSYATGETITIEVAFDRDVRVIAEDGTPTYEMRFGTPGVTDAHHAAYARVVGGNKVQFDYVVLEDDHDPDGFVAHGPAIHWNGGTITRAEVDETIARAVRADVSSTYLLRQDGHAVNAE